MRVTGTAVLFGIALCSPVSAQDHAILPEQCRADVHLWISQSKEDNNRLSFRDLLRRSSEMWNCQAIDRGAGEPLSSYKDDSENYQLLWAAYTAASEERLEHFVERHHLAKQFTAEDEAGQR